MDLLAHQDEGPVSVSDISDRLGISQSYLEQLFLALRRHGLVMSVRGPGGGYRLSRDPALIVVLEIVDAVNENIDVTRCRGAANCQDNKPCLTHYLWSEISDRIRAFLGNITLTELYDSHITVKK